MGFGLFILLVFGLTLIGTPIGVSAFTGHALSGLTSLIMTSFGVLTVLISVVLLTITQLYVKTKASEAIVRTGMGGLRVIRDGGSLIIPVVHQVSRVCLETIKLEVSRVGADALLTMDKLRADVKAEFFVRVQPEDDSIKAAARSLGDKMSESAVNGGRTGYQSSVAILIEDKLVSALRTAAAKKTLEQLNSDRDEFLREVMQGVTDDLKHNGFLLETVTISKLDQTDVSNLKKDNVFDAQGLRAAEEIVQRNLTERNALIRAGEQARTEQDVTTRTAVLDLEKKRAEAEALQSTQVIQVRAEQDRIAQESMLEAQRKIQVTTAENTQQVELAQVAQQQAIEVAKRSQQEAVVEADKLVEVAKRAQQQAIANSEAQKVAAEAKLADAEAERQKARQNIVTVEEVAKAEREKQKSVIAATAEADKNYVTAQKKAEADAFAAQMGADAAAYRVLKEADARKASSSAEAEAVTVGAEARSKAAQLEAEGRKAQLLADAEGQRALAMVPVEVKAREVVVDQDRVEKVLKPELEARAENGSVAQSFELSKLQIVQDANVRIETAKAMVNIYGKIQANVYGTPEDVARMGNNFMSGMGLSQALGGFMAGADASTVSTLQNTMGAVNNLIDAAANKVKSTPEKV